MSVVVLQQCSVKNRCSASLLSKKTFSPEVDSQTVRQSAYAKKVEDLIVEKQAMERTRARGECLCAAFQGA